MQPYAYNISIGLHIILKGVRIIAREKAEQQVFAKIFLVNNQLQRESGKLSEELTLKQWFFLIMLYKSKIPEPSVNDLAEQMGVSRQSAKKTVALLEKKAYVTVKSSTKDSRALCIAPTQQAIQFLRENRWRGNALLHSIFADIADEDMTTFVKVLNQVLSNAKQINEQEV